MDAQPGGDPGLVGETENGTVKGVPYRLIHVSQIHGPGLKDIVPAKGNERKQTGIQGPHEQDDGFAKSGFHIPESLDWLRLPARGIPKMMTANASPPTENSLASKLRTTAVESGM